jgi:CBS domain-containing protein
MHDHKIGCLPVVDGDRLAGLITETDALALLVDLFGLKMKGTRLTVAIEDQSGQMHGILDIIKNHNVNIISIVSPTFKVRGKRVAAIRIQTHQYEDLVKELEQQGHQVLSINKWAPCSLLFKNHTHFFNTLSDRLVRHGSAFISGSFPYGCTDLLFSPEI